MEQDHAPCLGLGLASALAAHTLLLAIPPCRYSFFYIEYHPYKDLWSHHIDSVTNGSNTGISSSIDPVNHPHVYTQSPHQHLIVWRSKPALSYTRSHRVPFDRYPLPRRIRTSYKDPLIVYIDPFIRPIDITMQTFLQILHEQYRNNDGWQTRECHP